MPRRETRTFEAAELGRAISKKDYESRLPPLRARLLDAQIALRTSGSPVVIIVSGADGAGKGDVVHRLNEWLDPRGVDTHAFWRVSDEARERPSYWRFWQALPGRGRVAILFGSWYTDPIIRRVYGDIRKSRFDSDLDRIAFFEQMLADDGARIVKLWFHISKKEQRKRLEALERDPRTRMRVLPTDWKHHKLYDRFIEVSDRAIRRTDSGVAPWHLVESTDSRHRDLTAGEIVLDVLERAGKPATAATRARPAIAAARARTSASARSAVTILDRVDLSQRLSPAAYQHRLEKWQARLNRLTWEAASRKRSCVTVFEGWDAAGKGSSIRRVTQAIDPRLFRVVSIAAPTDEERAHHYLWRFWRHLPRAGMTTIFDRSWYGRVLVERVEGFATEAEWSRAYLETNDFEEQLVESGIVVTKFWIHISRAEQLRRFKERQTTAYKHYKITDEDWRNRKQWDAYKTAVNDMVAHTSTEFAPWTLVAGDDKRFARIQILKTVCQHLSRAL